MYYINNKQATPITPTTFSELGMNEQNLEELIKENVNLITEDEESMLIIGQQVRNTSLGRCDLVAIDQNGNLVLIEIKRDRRDIEGRKEAFEFQAIRYAASFAKIKDIDEMIGKIYAPFLERNNSKENQTLTVNEISNRNINDFIKENGINPDNFNQHQQIILVASDFDEQTLSAVAWLNSNGVQIRCYKLKPYKIEDKLYLQSEKILPLEQYDTFYVDLLGKDSKLTRPRTASINRRVLPRINTMLEWGVVEAGDLLSVKGFKSPPAPLLANGNVLVGDEEKSLQQWLRDVTEWSSVATYAFAIDEKTGKSLSEIREEYMEREG
jgi:hypothetical protein